MSNDFIKNLKVSNGIVTYNDFDIQESIPFEQQKYSYKEDMLQIKFGDRFILDVGWLPDFDPDGYFVIQAILDEDWMNPLSQIKCSTLDELKEAIERTAVFINEMRKIKDIPPRDVEYEEFD